jgi:hypothetical protein
LRESATSGPILRESQDDDFILVFYGNSGFSASLTDRSFPR